MGVYDPDQSCAELHRVMIHDRGGRRRVDTLVDLTQVKWGRVRSGKSAAEIQIAGRAACSGQADALRSIEPRRHEMVIFRGDERVWEGPIVQVRTSRNLATINAFDGKEYLDYTALSKAWPNRENGGQPLMGDRLRDIISYELSTPYQASIGTGSATRLVTIPRWENIDPPANILPLLDVRSGSVQTLSVTAAFEMTVGEHMDNLAQSGLDYTFIGRKLLIWDSAISIGQTRRLTEADFYGDVEVISAGSEHYDIEHVSAQRPETLDGEDEADPPVPDPGVVFGVGNAGEANDYYGVWTDISSTSSEEGSTAPTQDELNGQAQRGLLGRTPVPVAIVVPPDAGLRLSYDLGINDLVPGMRMPVVAKLNVRTVSQPQVLDSMTVTETAKGERIQVTLSPIGGVEAVA